MHRPRAACAGRSAAETTCLEIERLRRGLREDSDAAVREGEDARARELRLSYLALRELIAHTDSEVAAHLCDGTGDQMIARQAEGILRSARLMAPAEEA